MPHYRITFSRQARGAHSAPVLWFVPMSRDMFPARESLSIEAPNARDAVIRFMVEQHVDVDPDQPVRGSPILHGWLLSGRVTIADYVDAFLNRKRRSLAFRRKDGVRWRVLSVEEQPEAMGTATATEPYQQPFASLEGRQATGD